MTTFDDVEIPGIGPSRRGRLLSAGVRDVDALAALDPKATTIPGIPPAILHAAIAAAQEVVKSAPKSTSPAKAAAAAKPKADAGKPVAAKAPVEAKTATEAPAAAEAKNPAEAPMPVEAKAHADAPKRTDGPKPAEAKRPVAVTKPAAAPPPAEAKTESEATKPAEAPVEPPPGLPPASDWLGRLAALAKDARRHARDARANGPRVRARKQLARLRDALAEAQTRVESGPMPAAWGTVLHSAEGALTRFLQDKPRKRAVEEVADAAKGARKELA